MHDDAPARLLLVEDDARLAALVAESLRRKGWQVDVVGRGDHAIERIRTDPPDLVILDVNLPGGDGFDVCRAVRGGFPGAILMLTARDDDIDQVVGLELGADDYVAKPVAPAVLAARIRALLRRGASARRVSAAGVTIDAAARDVRVRGEPVQLTTAEFDLLWALASSAGRIVSRDELMQSLRGLEFDGLDRSIDARVSRLRRKLRDDAEDPRLIKTVRGRGYLFASPDGPATR
ncbi:MAG: winged helix-turn-helix domain-containing protein [Burkholderiales bacterium]|jgi:two-component system OmpR family response regulator